jgi:hypothetical protein
MRIGFEIHRWGLSRDVHGPRTLPLVLENAVGPWSVGKHRAEVLVAVYGISLSKLVLAATGTAHKSMWPYDYGSVTSKKSGPLGGGGVVWCGGWPIKNF